MIGLKLTKSCSILTLHIFWIDCSALEHLSRRIRATRMAQWSNIWNITLNALYQNFGILLTEQLTPHHLLKTAITTLQMHW